MQTSDPSAWWWSECRSGMNQTPATHRMDALDQRHRPAAVRAAVRLLSTSSSLHSSTRSPTERQSHQLDVPLTGEGKAARTSGLHSYTDGSGLGVRMPSSRDSSVARARERYIKTRTLNCVTFTVDSEPPTPAPTLSELHIAYSHIFADDTHTFFTYRLGGRVTSTFVTKIIPV